MGCVTQVFVVVCKSVTHLMAKSGNNGTKTSRSNKSKMPQQSAVSSGNMPLNLPNQNVIGQEMLTRLLFQLPPDQGYNQNRMAPAMTSQNYPTFQKPIPTQPGMMFSSFPQPDQGMNYNTKHLQMSNNFNTNGEMPHMFDNYAANQPDPKQFETVNWSPYTLHPR